MDGRMDLWTDGQIDGQTDGQIDGQPLTDMHSRLKKLSPYLVASFHEKIVKSSKIFPDACSYF